MFAWWGHAVVRIRWAVLAGAAVLAIVGGIWGTGVFATLVSGGFDDPHSESTRALARIAVEVGRQDVDVVVLYSSESATVGDPSFREAVETTIAKVRQRPEVFGAVSYYDSANPVLVSRDQHATYVAITLAEADSMDMYEAIRDDLEAPGLRTAFAGSAAISADVTGRVSSDIAKAEMYSMPILMVLLLFVFGSVVAAGIPLLIGGLAILGAFLATRVITYFTDVSIFAINSITLIGLGLSIDYSLFIVSRFREEMAAGRDPVDAVRRTMTSAGRTVAVSGLTVALALASLLLFPQVFLRSMGFGGMIAVMVAMLGAVTVLPALLAVLGPRVNALRIRLPWIRRSSTGRSGWATLAHLVMRRPVLVIVGTLVILGVLASPFTRARFGGPDERVLPPGTASRVATERIASDFPGGANTSMRVLVSGAEKDAAVAFAELIRTVDGVTTATVTATRGRSSVISVGFTGSVARPAARQLVRDIRQLPAPDGAEVLVSGRSAGLADLLDSLGSTLPWMALVVALCTFVLLFLAFGSLVLPLKAIVMSFVSIGASFGAVVWVFQDGHLSNFLGFTSTGDLEATQLILMLAILFGLSTDYEVFILSRVREEWERTGDNVASVAGGLQRTGGIVTSAALLLVVVIGGFATGGTSFIKMIGVGMIVAIVVDATLVRILLVPATMRLLGSANWWLPGPLRRAHDRFGVAEGESATPAEAASPSRDLVSIL